MTLSVTVLTEREHVAQQWRQALSKHEIESKVVSPNHLADAVDGQAAVVVDIDGAQLDADQILSTIGFVRASGALPVAHVDRDRDALEDIVDEGVHDGHGAAGDSSVGVHLLQNLVDVDSVAFLALSAPLLVATWPGGLGLLRSLLSSGRCSFGRHDC